MECEQGEYCKKDKLKKINDKYLHPLIMVLILLSVLLLIEKRYPYFFLQDDNRGYFLPYIIHNMRSLVNGEFAFYDFHQFMGHPSLTTAQCSVFYPITYLSCIISQIIFGHYYAVMDIQVIIHLLAGALGTYKLTLLLCNSKKAGVFAGITLTLSSYVIYASNSWHVVAGAVAYLPWMLYFVINSYENLSKKHNMGAVAARVLLFYVGHFQYFLYSAIFELLTIVVYVIADLIKHKNKDKVIAYIKMYVLGYISVLIFMLPILLPTVHQMNISYLRGEKYDFNILYSNLYPLDMLLKGLFNPFKQTTYEGAISFINPQYLSHIGYSTLLLLFIGVVKKYILKRKVTEIEDRKISPFIFSATIALLWITNEYFLHIIHLIPIVNRFRWTFMITVYFDFFIIMVAAFCLGDIMGNMKIKKRTKNILFWALMALHIFNFVALYIFTPYKDFGEHHADAVSFVDEISDELTEGRVLSMDFNVWQGSPNNDVSYYTAPTFGFNFAKIYQIDYFAGYEPMVSYDNGSAALGLNFIAIFDSTYLNDHIDHFRYAGVCYYAVPTEKIDNYTDVFASYNFVKLFEDSYRTIFYDPNALPMIYETSGLEYTSNDFTVTANTIRINTDNNYDTTLVFNYVYNPFFVAYIDGKKIEISADETIHFNLDVQAGNHSIVIKYENPYLKLGILILLVFVVLCILIKLYGYRKLH